MNSITRSIVTLYMGLIPCIGFATNPTNSFNANAELPIRAKLNRMFHGHSEMQGRRQTMEDAVCITALRPDLHYVALFDGHGGDLAAKAAAGRIQGFRSIHSYIAALSQEYGRYRLQHAFLEFDKQFQENGDGSGSTAVVALIDGERYSDEQTLSIGHVGDSRLLLINADGSVDFATEDHKPDSPNELRRITQAGGRVEHWGVARVAGLAVSRALGDAWTKKMAGANVITADPSLTKIMLVPHKHTYLILACDGVWDVITNEEAARIVHELNPQSEEDCAQAAQVIRDAAYNQGSTDNISVAIVRLQW